MRSEIKTAHQKIITMKNLWNRFGRYAEQALVSDANFLVNILVARYLGISTYAAFALAFLWLLLTNAVLQSAILQPLAYFSAEFGKKEASRFFTKVFLAFSTLSAVGVSLYLIWAQETLAPNEAMSFIGWTLAYNAFHFTRHLNIMWGNLNRNVVGAMFSGGISVLGLLALGEVDRLSLTATLVVLGSAMLGGAVVQISGNRFGRRQDEAHLKQRIGLKAYFRYTRFLVATSIFQWTSGNYYLVLAGGILPAPLFGAFRLMQNIAGLINILMLALENHLPFQIMEYLSENGKKGLFRRMVSAMKFPVILLIVSVLMLIPPGDTLVGMLYGNEYAEHTHWLIYLVGIYFFVLGVLALRIIIRSMALNSWIFYANVTNALLSIAIAPCLLNTWGVYGLLGGLLISQLIIGVVMLKGLGLHLKTHWYENHSFYPR